MTWLRRLRAWHHTVTTTHPYPPLVPNAIWQLLADAGIDPAQITPSRSAP